MYCTGMILGRRSPYPDHFIMPHPSNESRLVALYNREFDLILAFTRLMFGGLCQIGRD